LSTNAPGSHLNGEAGPNGGGQGARSHGSNQGKDSPVCALRADDVPDPLRVPEGVETHPVLATKGRTFLCATLRA
jgi:hypothetical protein